ncbi:MAG: HNH endonuclease, partial [Paeniglutamicibacter sp.]
AAARKLEKLRPVIEARPDAAQVAEQIESRVAESLAEGDARNTTKLFDKIGDELDGTSSAPTAKEIRNKTGIAVTKRTRHFTYFTACMLNSDAEVFLSHFAASDNARTLAGNRQALAQAAEAVAEGAAANRTPATAHAAGANGTIETDGTGDADDAHDAIRTPAPHPAIDTATKPPAGGSSGASGQHTPTDPDETTTAQDPLFPSPETADGPDWFDHPAGAETFDDPPTEAGTAGVPEEPTPAQRHLQTLLNLMRNPGPAANGNTGLPTSKLFVYITLEVLLGLARGAGWSAHGLEIPVSELRQRLAEFGIIPITLGGDGQLLDYGRERRHPPESMKQAIRARDRGCLKPRCTVPPEHCDYHHIKPWSEGGTTSVWNLGMFCPSDHRGADKGDFEVVMKNGVPWVKLAPFEDPDQIPRRNKHWQGEQPPLF